MKKLSGNNSGFTLIELIIVIVIVSILALIAIPQYANLQEAAKQAAVDSSLGSIRSAHSIKYARTILGDPAANLVANPSASFESIVLTTSDFADGVMPTNARNGKAGITIITQASNPAATAVGTTGFWFNTTTKQYGAYGKDAAATTPAAS